MQDEIFHVPQAQAYCQGDYGTWDPKITTPPGLYAFAVAYAGLLTALREALLLLQGTATASSRVAGLFISQEQCVAAVLRQANWGLSLGALAVMRSLFVRRMAPGKALAHALLLWLYPVSFFFSFLLYTDTGATFFVLLCYLLATGPPRGGGWGRRLASALAGGVSVLFRQTNAVWVAFTLAACLLDDFTPSVVAAVRVSPGGDVSARAPAGALAVEPSSRRARDAAGTGSRLKSAGSWEHPLAPPCAGDGAAAEAVGGLDEGGAATTRRSGERSSPSPLQQSTTTTRRRRRNTDQKRVGSGSQQDAEVGLSRGGGGGGGGLGTDGEQTTGGSNNDIDSAQPRNGGAHPSLPPTPRLLLGLARAALTDASRGGTLLRARAPLAIPVALFAVFVWGFNGGAVVIGDKENHSPGGPPHLAQLAYLAATGASLWGVVGGREALLGRDARRGFARWAGGGRGRVATVVAGVAAVLWRYSLAHPFLLSDNRHYPFYVWQRLLSRVYVRVALAPAYVFCGWLVTSRLLRRKPPLWVLTYVGAAAVVLVPSPLLEPRYLTMPLLLAHLESPERSWKSLVVGVVACAAVNAVTIYVFLARPFAWHDGSLARFMW
ncbi:Alpha-1,2-glucosyltransferase ALG10-A, family GT59 [Ectocarpus siliculosus]|uniref:Dol-P-Glc:Glc(2)Man(9)GlcNAc(2)-PP-Dol alpha-1,2-glucosyltransferase n=1 Tax=Ectocarpus siliculosus TaxID=2880 RepID=D8LPS4_ECTSI|nr:Alpha-1,2-glucosyltransferase ALG10-A, family GT59 [Ectocarpus siliculosus]|eukprot:CBN77379.1 Alpha-1,2-glucosyltransferase ALG10-A, family GT59 [Ectocarpus siliculosus]